MKHLGSFFPYSIFLASLSCTISVLAKDIPRNTDTTIVLVGSTPGDEIIKSILTIPDSTKVDFIRWNLALNTGSNQNGFELKIAFGVSKPNTLDFVKEERLSFEGTYSLTRDSDGKLNGEIYHFDCIRLPAGISMVRLNDNLFHLLTPNNQLIKGNGGWSYMLNRKQPVNSSELPALTSSFSLLNDTSRQVIFEGRTPCLDFAKENNLTVAADCFKLKWKLILNRDPKTKLPTTYLLQRTNNRETGIIGKWAILKGAPSNPNVILYMLDPDKPEKTISLLAGDGNILYFLNKDNKLYVGNSDFSFTLNKRSQ